MGQHQQFRRTGMSTEASRSLRCIRHGRTSTELPEVWHRDAKNTEPPVRVMVAVVVVALGICTKSNFNNV